MPISKYGKEFFTMDLPKRIELIEVCPRDGFQNVHDIIPFEGKVAIIK